MADGEPDGAQTAPLQEPLPFGAPMPARVRWILALGVLFLVAYGLASLLLDLRHPFARVSLNVVFLFSPVAATVALGIAAWHARGRRRLAWGLLSASTWAWTLGQTLWAWEDLHDRALQRPSVADIGFVLSIPLAIAGLVLLWDWAAARWFGLRAVLEGTILGLSLFVPMWAFVLRPAQEGGMSPGPLFHAYPISSALIMTAALLILPRVSHIDWRRRLILGASILSITLGNTASLFLATVGGYHIGHPIDLLWLGGFLLLAAFAAYRDQPALPQPLATPQILTSPSVFTYAMLLGALFSATIDVARQGMLDQVLFSAGFVIVSCLLALQRMGQADARTLTRRVADQASQLASSLERLRQEGGRLKTAQEIAGLIEWRWHPATGQITAVETGRRPRAALALLSPARMPTEDRRALRAAIEATAAGQRPFDLQVRSRGLDGAPRWLRIWTEGGPTDTGVRGLAQDITVLKEVEAGRIERLEHEAEVRRLRELDHVRSTFINVAAHELNTPLTPIKVQLEILRRTLRLDGQPDVKHSFEVLDRSVERLAHLVVDLLDSGRLQSGRMKFSFAPADLGVLAAESVEAFQATAARAGVALFFESRGALPVRADVRRLHEVVDNLLSNAVKFTPPGGRIDVLVGAEAGAAVLRVRDSGVGLSREGLGLLFQPFSQVERPVRREDSGTGLGLFIARGIAAAHGGAVEADSPGVGAGSTFTLRLPLASPLPSAPAGVASERPTPRPSRRNA